MSDATGTGPLADLPPSDDKDKRDLPRAEMKASEKLETMRAENAELKDKYLRSLAEMDNFRKQQQRLAQDRTRQEKKTLLLRLIEVVDDLDRALNYQEVADRETLLNALKLTYSQLRTLLQRENVMTFPTEGEPFDPRMHEAIESVDVTGMPEGHVVQEVLRGYRYGDELLRPARVHVSSGRETATPQESQ